MAIRHSDSVSLAEPPRADFTRKGCAAPRVTAWQPEEICDANRADAGRIGHRAGLGVGGACGTKDRNDQAARGPRAERAKSRVLRHEQAAQGRYGSRPP